MAQIDYEITTVYKENLHLFLALGVPPGNLPCSTNIMGGVAATLKTGVQCGDTFE